MTSKEIRKKFINFFKDRGHAHIPSASIIPVDDPSALFISAGMQPLVPYLTGEEHPQGKRLVDIQKCVRTQDIDDVGDSRHTTFFEMLGVWSLGDYFKEDIIPWTFEFMTKDLGLDHKRMYVTVFSGSDQVEADKESVDLWKEIFKKAGIDATLASKDNPNIEDGHRIFQYGEKENWWGPIGISGPCGPDSEVFYDTGIEHNNEFGEVCHPNCECGRFIEIGNDVFMEYNKLKDGSYEPLKEKNIDVGWGVERFALVVQDKKSVFETDLFAPSISLLEEISGKKYEDNRKSMEIIVDHIRAATFIMGDRQGPVPSNVERGYVVRRFIRRAIRHGRLLSIEEPFIVRISETFINTMKEEYPELFQNKSKIMREFQQEEAKFSHTIKKGLREFEKLWNKKESIDGKDAFLLYSTYGFPIELTEELVQEKGSQVDHDAFQSEFIKHQDLSREGAKQKFAGGLADNDPKTIHGHTATHLLHQALRNVLGEHVEQKGSNITEERLRFDFTHPNKMKDEEKQEVEEWINEKIKEDLPVHFEMLEVEEAKKRGAIGLFDDAYAKMGNKIKVYFIGDNTGFVSKEICGGPHVESTGEIGSFKIIKEESVAAGIRRIKAKVE